MSQQELYKRSHTSSVMFAARQRQKNPLNFRQITQASALTASSSIKYLVENDTGNDTGKTPFYMLTHAGIQ
jgi:hypothetical protein